MKNIQNLKGAKALNKKEQKAINGGSTTNAQLWCENSGGVWVYHGPTIGYACLLGDKPTDKYK